MEHLLFAAYLILFAWLVTKIGFFKNSGLNSPQLIIVFLLKVIAGIFYGWMGVYYGEMAKMLDTWYFHYESMAEYKLLLKDPVEFVASLFRNQYEGGYGKFFSSDRSWWNDFHNGIFIKSLALFNFLSFGNYYINVIFYSFITLYGPLAIYRVMEHLFPTKKLQIVLATFLLPSFIYWSSGIHKDGLVFLGFALVIYNTYFGFKNGFNWSRWLLIFCGLLLILALRNYYLVIIIPALICWAMAEKMKYKPVVVFTGMYLLFTICFFSLRAVVPKLDFPAAVAEKQHAFLELKGGSAVPVKRLEPTVISFIKNGPQAFALAAIRPFPSDVKHLLSLAAAVEINVLLLCFLFFLFWRKNGKPVSPFLLFCIFFAFTGLLTIGYTVNFLGAIVRYRSIILPFLIIPMIALTNWNKLYQIVLKKH